MKFCKIALCALLCMAGMSCSKEVRDDNSSAKGTVTFAVSGDDNVNVVTKSQVSDFTTLPASGAFTITVKDQSGNQVWSGLVSEWDSETQLAEGSYSVDAQYGAEGIEGFDKPYFAGSANFTINGGQITTVKVPVELRNSIVKITVSDMFKKYYPQYAFTIATGSGATIEFPSTETRAAFVDAYKFTASGVFTSQAGNNQTFSKEYVSLEAKTCYTLAFDINTVGGVTITITFNDTVETINVPTVDLND